MIDLKRISDKLKDRIKEFSPEISPRSTGKIIYSGDGIIKIDGLSKAKYGELLEIDGGGYCLALNLEKDCIGAVLFEENENAYYGNTVYSTGSAIKMCVGEQVLGRVLNPLGFAVDGKSEVKNAIYRNVEVSAPSIMDRDKVNEPLETGILAIDSMIPIGKGQRELIIGDRQTGKTAIAIDAILNQKGKNVYCVYTSIGQKASTLASIMNVLKDNGAMEYTTIICSTANDPAPLQYLAPYSACSVAEEFMYNGKDVLIIYDDLSKHAVSYRTMSLLLKRPAGREAYPGDIFYLHSRLLERSAKLSQAKGGGSMTALPIVETLAGDISAYIPTNVISITDGQIYLESELFNSGIRPAVNVGLSVSRVGGSAQSKAMRFIAGHLRLDLAQYRDLAIFSQFGQELDKGTRQILLQGERITETLKQPQYKNYSQEEMIVLLFANSSPLVEKISVKAMTNFNKGLLEHIQTTKPEVFEILKGGEFTEEVKDMIIDGLKEYISYMSQEDMAKEKENA